MPKKISGKVIRGESPTKDPLESVRIDSSEQTLTTNQGVAIADNQNSLTVGLRGPTAMEDFILREKLTHFDHERIPERVVHARGSAAHGYFENYAAIPEITIAAPFSAAGKKTPVFVRFSTVAGERGSTDTARDARGFAVKFYTDAGNWDLVGNNIPVFFIQDAMKFPDLIHAVKPEPHNGIPQAASAHDTFWDFVSLIPESTHMLMWVMSDRAIPRSYRMMQGFGVHTFRLVNVDGQSVLCKFHWTPMAGTHSLVWNEAVMISGADSDFHRRDLWDAIESGAFPQWELGVQIFTEAEADSFSFDVLDPTKLVPEELVPVRPLGKMTLNRNPDNFFAESEQVAFCTAHIIPGIDFTNDPLLQGRIHSYVDTQISRLGGPNFHEIPINAPVIPVHNNQRDGMHRQAIHQGRVAYEPNSLGGGCPFQAGMAGYKSYPEHVEADKVRGKPELFSDHYSQARLFWESQTDIERQHIISAFRFELTRVQILEVRKRVISMLRNVSDELASELATDLGMPLPEAMPRNPAIKIPKYAASPTLSLTAYPGSSGISTRHVAILVSNNIDAESTSLLYDALLKEGAVPHIVGRRLGSVTTSQGKQFQVEVSLEAAPAALYDAVAIAHTDNHTHDLARDDAALEFIRHQYRHCKPIFVIGRGMELLENAALSTSLPNGEEDTSIVTVTAPHLNKKYINESITRFKKALAAHREYKRELTHKSDGKN